MPYIRSFWTDSTPGIQSAQTRDEGNHPVCAFYEINAVECYEAYGFYRGERYCRDFQQDWDECITGWKQVTSLPVHVSALISLHVLCLPVGQEHRYTLMLLERMKKVASGERPANFDGFWGYKPHPQGIWIRGFRN